MSAGATSGAGGWVAQPGIHLVSAAQWTINAALEFSGAAAARLHLSFSSPVGELVHAAVELHSFPHEAGAAAAIDLDDLRLHLETHLHADLGFTFKARCELAL